MKQISRVVSTSFWEDEKVVNSFSPEDKYFMLYLLTNPHTTQLGIYLLVPKIAAFEMGYSVEAVKVLLDRFENKYGILKYSEETSEVAIKNYLKYSVIKGGKPVMDCLLKDEKQVKDKSLLGYICNNLSVNTDSLNTTVIDYISSLINNLSLNTDIRKDNDTDKYINDNDNDNDNERIVDDSWYDSCQKPKKHDIEGFFNDIWKLYPKKVGKGKVSKTRKNVLFRIGKDQMARCIERYKEFIDQKGISEQYIMNGSTFFNSGYVDFLDENYNQTTITEEPVKEPEPEEPINMFDVDDETYFRMRHGDAL